MSQVRPRLLLADEPTGSLDSRTGREILELPLKVSAEHGKTLLVVTHDPNVAEQCGRRIELSDGRTTAEVDAAAHS